MVLITINIFFKEQSLFVSGWNCFHKHGNHILSKEIMNVVVVNVVGENGFIVCLLWFFLYSILKKNVFSSFSLFSLSFCFETGTYCVDQIGLEFSCFRPPSGQDDRHEPPHPEKVVTLYIIKYGFCTTFGLFTENHKPGTPCSQMPVRGTSVEGPKGPKYSIKEQETKQPARGKPRLALLAESAVWECSFHWGVS